MQVGLLWIDKLNPLHCSGSREEEVAEAGDGEGEGRRKLRKGKIWGSGKS